MKISMRIISFRDLKTEKFSMWNREGRMSPRKRFVDEDEILSSAL
jgi:hypothetical protein